MFWQKHLLKEGVEYIWGPWFYLLLSLALQGYHS